MGADASNRLYLLVDDSEDTLKLIRTDRDGVVDATYADHGSLTLGLPPSRRHVITPLTESVSDPEGELVRTGLLGLQRPDLGRFCRQRRRRGPCRIHGCA